ILVEDWSVYLGIDRYSRGRYIEELRRVFRTPKRNPDGYIVDSAENVARDLAHISFRNLSKGSPPEPIGVECDEGLCACPIALKSYFTGEVDGVLPSFNEDHVIFVNPQTSVNDTLCNAVLKQESNRLVTLGTMPYISVQWSRGVSSLPNQGDRRHAIDLVGCHSERPNPTTISE